MLQMSRTSRVARAARVTGALAVAAALLTSCDNPTAPALSLTAVDGAQLLACPTTTPQSTSRLVIPVLGGLVSLDGSSIAIPSLALSLPTRISVAIPASEYMQVDIQANDLLHYLFKRPVQVTIDYSRCGDVQGDLTVWYIDPTTKERLADMGGTDNRALRRITFTTDHLSSYAIANRLASPDSEPGTAP